MLCRQFSFDARQKIVITKFVQSLDYFFHDFQGEKKLKHSKRNSKLIFKKSCEFFRVNILEASPLKNLKRKGSIDVMKKKKLAKNVAKFQRADF